VVFGSENKRKIKIGILTVSDRCDRKEREDESGRIALEFFNESANIIHYFIVPDEIEAIQKALLEMSDVRKADVIFTLGGTGLSPRDVTPEATTPLIERSVPGLMEYVRSRAFDKNPYAAISRAVAGLRKTTLIINLPGNPKAVLEQFTLLSPLLHHIREMIEGGDHMSQVKCLKSVETKKVSR